MFVRVDPQSIHAVQQIKPRAAPLGKISGQAQNIRHTPSACTRTHISRANSRISASGSTDPWSSSHRGHPPCHVTASNISRRFARSMRRAHRKAQPQRQLKNSADSPMCVMSFAGCQNFFSGASCPAPTALPGWPSCHHRTSGQDVRPSKHSAIPATALSPSPKSPARHRARDYWDDPLRQRICQPRPPDRRLQHLPA